MCSQLVPSVAIGERERMENQLRQLQMNKEEKLGKLVDLQAKCNTISQNEDIGQATALITKIQEKVQNEK